MATENVVGRSRGDCVGLAAASFDRFNGLFPRLAESDVETGGIKSNVSTEDSTQQDVAGLLVVDFIPVNPVLLDENGFESKLCGNGRNLTRVVRLHSAD